MPKGNSGNPNCKRRSNCCLDKCDDSHLRDELIANMKKKDDPSQASELVQARVEQKSKSAQTKDTQAKGTFEKAPQTLFKKTEKQLKPVVKKLDPIGQRLKSAPQEYFFYVAMLR